MSFKPAFQHPPVIARSYYVGEGIYPAPEPLGRTAIDPRKTAGAQRPRAADARGRPGPAAAANTPAPPRRTARGRGRPPLPAASPAAPPISPRGRARGRGPSPPADGPEHGATGDGGSCRRGPRGGGAGRYRRGRSTLQGPPAYPGSTPGGSTQKRGGSGVPPRAPPRRGVLPRPGGGGPLGVRPLPLGTPPLCGV